MRLERLSPATQEPALEYLSRSPYTTVLISHLILADLQLAPKRNVLVALDNSGVRGVAYYGRQMALAADSDALPAFADHARHARGERMIVGERATVSAFWELIRPWHAQPRLVRDRQLVMMVDRKRLRTSDSRVEVRHARATEWAAVADGTARMVQQELEYDPRREPASFADNVRQMIARKLWWVGVVDRQLCFFCNVGPWCSKTAQLQGIWSPPEFRGRGYATAALAAICDRLLELSPTLSLFVNDFNRAAVALYDRVGFEHVADFQTILF